MRIVNRKIITSMIFDNAIPELQLSVHRPGYETAAGRSTWPTGRLPSAATFDGSSRPSAADFCSQIFADFRHSFGNLSFPERYGTFKFCTE